MPLRLQGRRIAWLLPLVAVSALSAQTTQEPAQAEPLPAPQGQVLFQSHGEPPQADSDRVPMKAAPLAEDLKVTDREREAVRVETYALDAHIRQADAGLTVHGRLLLRNVGAQPMTRVVLQLSSTLRWDSAAVMDRAGSRRLVLAQQLVDTDADHTGRASEAVVTLERPLQPNARVTLEVFYSGTVAPDATRLRRLGATEGQAAASDWDGITAQDVALRGFGDVLWYPVAAPPLMLGEGNRLFEAVGRARLADETTLVTLHLSVEYGDAAPVAAFFCTRRQAMTVAGGNVATADFAEQDAGFRALSLFVTADVSKPVGISDVAEVAAGEDNGSLPRLGAAVDGVAPMLTEWLGDKPATRLSIVDHVGQPFADGALLVGPVDELASSDAVPGLVRSLAQAWLHTGQPWIDDGLAEFLAQEWTEREHGRAAAVAQLDDLVAPLAIGEPDLKPETDLATASPGQPLVAATDEVFYRRKAAAVWWMLREMLGDDQFRAGLIAWRQHLRPGDTAEMQNFALQRALEDAGHENLTWLFDDWILHDKGLPDLTLADVTPRLLPAGAGHGSGWLVAVTVRNDGAAAADVPLVIRSGTFTATRRMHINAFGSATERVLLEAQPTEVMVNDGVMPEARSSVHSRMLTIHE